MIQFRNISKTREVPIICYKYNKPVRNIIFNYNKIVSDLDIQSNTPTDWDCTKSKFCNSDYGHIITGNFDIIHDKRIRNLFLKGPKYRLPSDINFDACRGQIADSIETFFYKIVLSWVMRFQLGNVLSLK